MKKVQYRLYVKQGFSKYPEWREWWSRRDWGWTTDLEKVKCHLEEVLRDFDGKPFVSKSESRSKETAKELMITAWRIRKREVEYLDDELSGEVEYPDVSGMEDPREDWIAL